MRLIRQSPTSQHPASDSGYGAYYGYQGFGVEFEGAAFGYQAQLGAQTDANGLVLMGHRYYDSGTGRWLTRDPIGYDGGINLYAYTNNNPVNFSDPLGLFVVNVGLGANADFGIHGGGASGITFNSDGPLGPRVVFSRRGERDAGLHRADIVRSIYARCSEERCRCGEQTARSRLHG